MFVEKKQKPDEVSRTEAGDRQKIGVEGEDAVLQFLLERGMSLMERNWRHNHLEVDLIMLDRDGVHFVEVKTRTAPALVDPQMSVTRVKRHFLLKAASAFISARGIDRDSHFDVAAVTISPSGLEINYLQDAFTQFGV